MITDSYRPQFSDALKMKRRMTRIGFQKLKVLASQGANVFGEGVIGGPES